MFKVNIEVPDIVLASLLLTLNYFSHLFECVSTDFEHVNGGWNTLMS